MTIFAIGAHPDDPEEGAGGTLARLAGLDPNTPLQENIKIVYVTRGQKGILGKSSEEAASIRLEEAKNSCQILHAEPYFLDFIDGQVFPTEAGVEAIAELLDQEQPKAVLTCWPLDTHPDHRATAFMVIEAYGRVYGNSFSTSMRDPLDLGNYDAKDPMKLPGLFFGPLSPGSKRYNSSPL